MKWFPEFLSDEDITETMKSCIGYMPDDACTFWRGVYSREDKSYLKEAICEAHNDIDSDWAKCVERKEAQINEKCKTEPHYFDHAHDGKYFRITAKESDTYKLELLKAMKRAWLANLTRKGGWNQPQRQGIINKSLSFDPNHIRERWIQNGISTVPINNGFSGKESDKDKHDPPQDVQDAMAYLSDYVGLTPEPIEGYRRYYAKGKIKDLPLKQDRVYNLEFYRKWIYNPKTKNPVSKSTLEKAYYGL